MSERTTWTTDDEIDYIKNIGSTRPGVSKIKMLTGYGKSLLNRKNWGQLDKLKVETYFITTYSKELNKIFNKRK